MKGYEEVPTLYSVSLIFNNSKEKINFINIIQKEALNDLSLKVKVDQEEGEVILSGQGPLHIEVILNDIKDRYGLKVQTKGVQIAFYESPQTSMRQTLILDRNISGK